MISNEEYGSINKYQSHIGLTSDNKTIFSMISGLMDFLSLSSQIIQTLFLSNSSEIIEHIHEITIVHNLSYE